jgi:hypothetical protein
MVGQHLTICAAPLDFVAEAECLLLVTPLVIRFSTKHRHMLPNT